jgi:hypothetical protein
MRKSWKVVIAIGLVLCSFAMPLPVAASDTGEIIWRFPAKGDTAGDYTLQFARATKDNTVEPVIEADSRGDKVEWHAVIALPPDFSRRARTI